MIDEFDWPRLRHAYGTATDTPGHLAALTSSDENALHEALVHLDAAILHQGFPDTATAPAARVVTRMIASGAVTGTVRDALVEFVGDVAHAVSGLRDERFFADLRPELEEWAVASYPVVAGLLDEDGPETSVWRAAAAAVALVRGERLAAERAGLAARLWDRARRPAADRHRWVMLLADLGADLRELLDDPDEAVRIQAALAPSSSGDVRATEMIIAALSDPLPRDVHLAELVGAAIDRAGSFDRIAGPAALIATAAEPVSCDFTWGPLLRFAFPRPYGPGTALSPEQRRFLAALAGNRRLWDPRDGNVRLLFRQVGLPHDRGECARIAGDAARSAP